MISKIFVSSDSEKILDLAKNGANAISIPAQKFLMIAVLNGFHGSMLSHGSKKIW